MLKAIFLDRDGTINEEVNYLYEIEKFAFIPGVPEALAQLKKAGYLLLVVTNQAGIARGYYTESDVQLLHSYINQCLFKQSVQIDRFYYCPHHPQGKGKYKKECLCRKPNVGMLERACTDFFIDRKKSFLIGDNQGDILAAKNFGIPSILVRTGHGKSVEKQLEKDYLYCAENLAEAVEWILAKEK
ncbi:hypothetical protein FACS189418_3330 [Clostridia bacterium]|nr:hypothetical protein FACS189418_3330 [Clostridia bacterium]